MPTGRSERTSFVEGDAECVARRSPDRRLRSGDGRPGRPLGEGPVRPHGEITGRAGEAAGGAFDRRIPDHHPRRVECAPRETEGVVPGHVTASKPREVASVRRARRRQAQRFDETLEHEFVQGRPTGSRFDHETSGQQVAGVGIREAFAGYAKSDSRSSTSPTHRSARSPPTGRPTRARRSPGRLRRARGRHARRVVEQMAQRDRRVVRQTLEPRAIGEPSGTGSSRSTTPSSARETAVAATKVLPTLAASIGVSGRIAIPRSTSANPLAAVCTETAGEHDGGRDSRQAVLGAHFVERARQFVVDQGVRDRARGHDRHTHRDHEQRGGRGHPAGPTDASRVHRRAAGEHDRHRRHDPGHREEYLTALGEGDQLSREVHHGVQHDHDQDAAPRVDVDPRHDHAQRDHAHEEQQRLEREEPHRGMVGARNEEGRQVPHRPHHAEDHTGSHRAVAFHESILRVATPTHLLEERNQTDDPQRQDLRRRVGEERTRRFAPGWSGAAEQPVERTRCDLQSEGNRDDGDHPRPGEATDVDHAPPEVAALLAGPGSLREVDAGDTRADHRAQQQGSGECRSVRQVEDDQDAAERPRPQEGDGEEGPGTRQDRGAGARFVHDRSPGSRSDCDPSWGSSSAVLDNQAKEPAGAFNRVSARSGNASDRRVMAVRSQG